MVPSQAFLDDSGEAALTTVPPWGSSAPYMALVMAAFTPAPTLALGDLTLANFTGATPKVSGAATPAFYTDPVTGDYVALLVEPAGGWKWSPTDDTNLPQTIYGYACLDHAQAVLMASQLFDPPLEITAVGQLIQIGGVEFRINNQFIF